MEIKRTVDRWAEQNSQLSFTICIPSRKESIYSYLYSLGIILPLLVVHEDLGIRNYLSKSATIHLLKRDAV